MSTATEHQKTYIWSGRNSLLERKGYLGDADGKLGVGGTLRGILFGIISERPADKVVGRR